MASIILVTPAEQQHESKLEAGRSGKWERITVWDNPKFPMPRPGKDKRNFEDYLKEHVKTLESRGIPAEIRWDEGEYEDGTRGPVCALFRAFGSNESLPQETRG